MIAPNFLNIKRKHIANKSVDYFVKNIYVFFTENSNQALNLLMKNTYKCAYGV